VKRRHRALVATTALAALALGAAAAIGALGGHPRKATSGFRLAGHVSGLYPGVHKRMVIVVRNRGRKALRVRSITTRVRNAKGGCSRRNLHVSGWRGSLRVKGRSSRHVKVRVWLLPDSPAVCQGALFRLVFRGRATRG
jgi:hypothetical protein